jgi:carbon monoxide dehydrogenase subunit G
MSITVNVDLAYNRVLWTAVPGEGNALVSGSWEITDEKKSTHLELQLQGELTLPLPGLMKMMVAPVVEAEFEKLVEHYIQKLTEEFGGEV